MATQCESGGSTSTLLQRLFKSPDLKQFLESDIDVYDLPVFHEYIGSLCREMDLIPEQVIRQASIERTYGHQLFNGTRKPSRDKAIQLAFGFGMETEDAQMLLRIAQKNPLYPRIKRDAAILFCLKHHKSVVETQTVLQSLGLTLLGREDKHA